MMAGNRGGHQNFFEPDWPLERIMPRARSGGRRGCRPPHYRLIQALPWRAWMMMDMRWSRNGCRRRPATQGIAVQAAEVRRATGGRWRQLCMLTAALRVVMMVLMNVTGSTQRTAGTIIATASTRLLLEILSFTAWKEASFVNTINFLPKKHAWLMWQTYIILILNKTKKFLCYTHIWIHQSGALKLEKMKVLSLMGFPECLKETELHQCYAVLDRISRMDN